MDSERRCVICGKLLTGRRTRYCSDECARQGANALVREVTSKRPHPLPYHVITCPDCGAVVEVPIKSKRCRPCQDEANRRADRACKERRRLGKTRPIGSTDLCARCGKPYTVNGSLQRYCPICAPIATSENDRAASRAWNKAHYSTPEAHDARNAGRRRPVPDPKVCPICGTTFIPSSMHDVYCSPECLAAAQKQQNAQYLRDNRPRVNARQRVNYKKRLAAMTPEQLAEHREKINARASKNYKKRQQAKVKDPAT